ncbi:hypothetical protein [Streptosporangium sp. NBC_01469]|uniref:hypothetical protein n=1 Tax=Streptosporangium sp. NBC_01469 TaxID=2903898 RepID=UPI002E2BD95F|nr:hypothetical protein [Streptosporangium sp. NBC_01469]
MASGQTVTEAHAGGHEGDETASPAGQEIPEGLSDLARLVSAQGVRTSIIHYVGLHLHSHRPLPFPREDRFELIAHSRGGWEVASVTVGDRSGCFVVSLSSVGVTAQMVNADQPHAVVDLILAALPKDVA